MDSDGVEDHKRHDGLYRFLEKYYLRVIVLVGVVQNLNGQSGNEHCANANGTKVPAEHGLAERLDIWNPAVQNDYDGKVTEEKYQDGNDDETPDAKTRLASGNLLKGIHAPTKINAATLNNVSTTLLNTLSSVCLLKKPSQANAVPQQNAAKRSSEPKRVQTLMVRIASERYCAT